MEEYSAEDNGSPIQSDYSLILGIDKRLILDGALCWISHASGISRLELRGANAEIKVLTEWR